MVLNQAIKNTMNGMIYKLASSICKRGHDKLFQLFLDKFPMSFQDLSGGNGKLLRGFSFDENYRQTFQDSHLHFGWQALLAVKT
jgi:hypothetical protein